MKLGWTEKMAITNPLRPLVQKYFEGPQLLRMGGITPGAKALEIGCGSGRFYVEEITRQFIDHPVWCRLLDHPRENRFDRRELVDGLQKAGFDVCRSRQFAGLFIWCVAVRISQY